MAEKQIRTPDENWDTASKDRIRDLERNKQKPDQNRPKGEITIKHNHDHDDQTDDEQDADKVEHES